MGQAKSSPVLPARLNVHGVDLPTILACHTIGRLPTGLIQVGEINLPENAEILNYRVYGKYTCIESSVPILHCDGLQKYHVSQIFIGDHCRYSFTGARMRHLRDVNAILVDETVKSDTTGMFETKYTVVDDVQSTTVPSAGIMEFDKLEQLEGSKYIVRDFNSGTGFTTFLCIITGIYHLVDCRLPFPNVNYLQFNYLTSNLVLVPIEGKIHCRWLLPSSEIISSIYDTIAYDCILYGNIDARYVDRAANSIGTGPIPPAAFITYGSTDTICNMYPFHGGYFEVVRQRNATGRYFVLHVRAVVLGTEVGRTQLQATSNGNVERASVAIEFDEKLECVGCMSDVFYMRKGTSVYIWAF